MVNFEKHTSKSYDNHLGHASDLFLQMGMLVSSQIGGSIDALMACDGISASLIIEQDKVVNELERQIDNCIMDLVATRQPTAGDLRFIINMSKGVVDLERIGDEASKIARMAKNFSHRSTGVNGCLEDCRLLGEQVRLMVTDAMDAFANGDAKLAFDVMQNDSLIDKQYQKAVLDLQNAKLEVVDLVDLLWVLRALERIGDHARNLAELVIYTGSGTNVSHQSYETVQKAVTVASGQKA